eukprot:COSAG01_NODE_68326_length_264_cov_0.927273_1_plen_84_part_10
MQAIWRNRCNLPVKCVHTYRTRPRRSSALHGGRLSFKFGDRFWHTTGVRIADLAGLIIDEVSFITPEVLGRVSRLFEYARGRVG